ncbi:MAG: class I SAM-dependent methyltransferase [Chloroflexi bacterium]|nr:class I SAM-dependent methyltransferase [Chloroflexota bacterium]
MKTISKFLYRRMPKIRQTLTRTTYEYVSSIDKQNQVLFMNYGYANLNQDLKPIQLPLQEEKFRYEIQLYHHLASFINWHGLEALEVSSGRGGGANYIKQQFKPKSLIGVDFSSKAVDFCNRYYAHVAGLSFIRGNAESLEFADNSFDVVINVEASFYYPKIERFFDHVVRILKPNGHFLYTDMRYSTELNTWHKQLEATGLALLQETDISYNVIAALELDKERRIQLIQENVPKILFTPFSQLIGVTGGGLIPHPSRIGERVYKSFVFKKSG